MENATSLALRHVSTRATGNGIIAGLTQSGTPPANCAPAAMARHSWGHVAVISDTGYTRGYCHVTAARRHQATVVAEGELSVGDLILVDTGLLVHHLRHPCARILGTRSLRACELLIASLLFPVMTGTARVSIVDVLFLL